MRSCCHGTARYLFVTSKSNVVANQRFLVGSSISRPTRPGGRLPRCPTGLLAGRVAQDPPVRARRILTWPVGLPVQSRRDRIASRSASRMARRSSASGIRRSVGGAAFRGATGPLCPRHRRRSPAAGRLAFEQEQALKHRSKTTLARHRPSRRSCVFTRVVRARVRQKIVRSCQNDRKSGLLHVARLAASRPGGLALTGVVCRPRHTTPGGPIRSAYENALNSAATLSGGTH